ncbi:Genetic interactor of prohibitin 7 mitochondrial [Dissostichus eleginoides]|uniref:Genetic interactor of prohibitin 7 mitochondrial n=1 Tax=Dissostichus eleginoides TaxID=100907 RepID=A0AAD9FDA0_DISEL|nr:Genetic interactor of prohibitin 7 mitochondrial [Dissostichus eleginoides]
MVTAAVKWITQQPVQQACRLIGTAVQLVQQAVSQDTSKHTAGGKHGNTDRELAPEYIFPQPSPEQLPASSGHQSVTDPASCLRL